MNNSEKQQRVASALDRLFRTYPSFGQGDSAGDMLRDRVEKAKVYFEAVSIYEIVDIEAAVNAFLNGSAPGHNPAYAPPAPFVGAETRRQMNLRLDAALRQRKPALPAPTIEHSPDERARIAAMADELVKRTAEQLNTPDNATHRKSVWGPVHQRFYPDMSPSATKRRLGLGFDVGDADEDAA